MLELRRRERALLFGAVGANTLVYTGARIVNGNRERICLSTAWDDAIPFLPWTILVYWGLALVLWGSGYHLAAKQDKAEANRFFLAHLLGEGVCFLCFVMFPTTLERPDVMINGPFSWMVQLTYVLDRPDNLHPSIHCFVSWLCHLGVRDNSKVPLWYRRLSFLSAAVVCVSTLTVKQHVLADAAAGIVLAEVSFWAAGHFVRIRERIEKNTAS